VLILRSPDGARAARPHASNARAAFRRPIDLAKESSHRAHDWRDDGFRAAGEASRALRIQLPLAAPVPGFAATRRAFAIAANSAVSCSGLVRNAIVPKASQRAHTGVALSGQQDGRYFRTLACQALHAARAA